MAKLQELGEFVRSASSTIEAPVVRKLTDALQQGNGGGKSAPARKAAPAKPAAPSRRRLPVRPPRARRPPSRPPRSPRLLPRRPLPAPVPLRPEARAAARPGVPGSDHARVHGAPVGSRRTGRLPGLRSASGRPASGRPGPASGRPASGWPRPGPW
nr:hypothetical protein [Streptomyces sp. F001]